MLHAVEKDYYHQKCESTTHDIKKTWQVIKTIIGKNTLSVPVESFRSNNTTISDKSEIVDKFNKFFVNIGPTLANKISASQVCYSSFLKGDYSNSFSLFFTDPTEIISIVNSLKPKVSACYELLSTEMLKYIIPNVAEPLIIGNIIIL